MPDELTPTPESCDPSNTPIEELVEELPEEDIEAIRSILREEDQGGAGE